MHYIQLDLMHLVEFTIKTDTFHIEQPAQDNDSFFHGLEGFASVDAYILCQRIPPGADTADDAVWSQVIQGQEG